jgi:uncharacterized protein YqjF (DUF2071 family)
MTVAYLVWVRPFLTANWRYLAMLNFVVDPKIVAPLVPPGTELNFENGETFLSVVGFLFLDTRLLGLPIPLHRDFEEVNLRFYVRKNPPTPGAVASSSFANWCRAARSLWSRVHFTEKSTSRCR